MAVELRKLDTEQRNPRSARIDTLSTLEMVSLMNSEDHRCAEAVREALPEIARSIDIIYDKLRAGGRLFYCGAGTSGRLGVLDAAECPPTYGVDPGLVVALIAGGPPAFLKAVEGAEDSRELGARDLAAHDFSSRDALVGIALFLTMMAKKAKKVSEIKKEYPAYEISKNKIQLTPEIDVDLILEKMKAKYSNEDVTDIDGVKIDFPTKWVHLRKSNTEPIIRIYSEASTAKEADELAQAIIADIKSLI